MHVQKSWASQIALYFVNKTGNNTWVQRFIKMCKHINTEYNAKTAALA